MIQFEYANNDTALPMESSFVNEIEKSDVFEYDEDETLLSDIEVYEVLLKDTTTILQALNGERPLHGCKEAYIAGEKFDTQKKKIRQYTPTTWFVGDATHWSFSRYIYNLAFKHGLNREPSVVDEVDGKLLDGKFKGTTEKLKIQIKYFIKQNHYLWVNQDLVEFNSEYRKAKIEKLLAVLNTLLLITVFTAAFIIPMVATQFSHDDFVASDNRYANLYRDDVLAGYRRRGQYSTDKNEIFSSSASYIFKAWSSACFITFSLFIGIGLMTAITVSDLEHVKRIHTFQNGVFCCYIIVFLAWMLYFFAFIFFSNTLILSVFIRLPKYCDVHSIANSGETSFSAFFRYIYAGSYNQSSHTLIEDCIYQYEDYVGSFWNSVLSYTVPALAFGILFVSFIFNMYVKYRYRGVVRYLLEVQEEVAKKKDELIERLNRNSEFREKKLRMCTKAEAKSRPQSRQAFL